MHLNLATGPEYKCVCSSVPASTIDATSFLLDILSSSSRLIMFGTENRKIKAPNEIFHEIRAVAGQRSSPDLCFATTSVKIYDP